MKTVLGALVLLTVSASLSAKTITVDISGARSGAVTVSNNDGTLQVAWVDGSQHKWQMTFALDTARPVIAGVTADGKPVLDAARPVYRCSTGKRTGGWDQFFDHPPLSAEGIREFRAQFSPTNATVKTVGDRVEVSFDGMSCGSFSGVLKYVFYPGSALVQQLAVMSTHEPDTAYIYDAGIEMRAQADERVGGRMGSAISYYDTRGELKQITPVYASERQPVEVKYRALAANMGTGSIVAFPAPHRYFFARDYTTNMGFAWYTSWRGQVSLGIRQLPDDNSPYYPWMNAPPGTQQEMGMFLQFGTGSSQDTLKEVLAYTHGDRFPHVGGYITFAPHWHEAYTVQAVANGLQWQPPFKEVMQSIGLDSAMIMDFHGDGHPQALTDVRLKELKSYYEACRAQSNKNFLLIPAEEADIILGGHWALVFPHPVYWYMDRKAGEPLKTTEPGYGTVWRVGTGADILAMVKAEDGWMYETHPRTKGSTGFPDKILGEAFFKDARYFGVGWKQMPSDLSSPRLGERGFKTVDDLNNLGMHKRMIGEVDVFQLDTTHELYAHMNVNYLKLDALPDFDHYGRVMDAAANGEGFISTGEILLPKVTISGAGGDVVRVHAQVAWTFPLQMAEVVWGDGKETHHEIIALDSTRGFGSNEFDWRATAPRWTWARVAVWDIAGDGAFTNPTWR
jgi:hypothetical protein